MQRKLLAAGLTMLVLLAAPAGAGASISTTSKNVGGTTGSSRVRAIVVVNGIAFVGGNFTQVVDRQGHVFNRQNLAAFKPNGTVTNWAPKANGTVFALAVNGTRIFAGGSFTAVNGKPAKGLVALNQKGKRLWGGGVQGQVRALRVAGGRLFVGGDFAKVQGTTRHRLAALNAVNGALTKWNPHANGPVNALAAVGKRIFAGGSFTKIGGHPVRYLVNLSQKTGGHLPFAQPQNPITALAFGTHLFTAASGPGGRIAAYNLAGKRIWLHLTDGSSAAIAVAKNQVVYGGHFNNVCSGNTGGGNPFTCTKNIPRAHLLAVRPSDGKLLAWAPQVNSPLGVFAARAGTSLIWVGGDFTSIGAPKRPHLAAFTYS
jgi:hypothetical protein